MRNDKAFTLIETLAILLVLTIGMAAAIGLMLYGVRTARESQYQALAYPTAKSLIYDAKPPNQPRWSQISAERWEGYVNGIWATREIKASSINTLGGLTFATVTVSVYPNTSSDTATLTLRERLCLHTP